jgi:cytoskeletal protein CcmA (bactofilin family)
MFFKKYKKNQDQVNGVSHLGESSRFEGEIDCKGEIEIAGKVNGNIKAKKLRILESGTVRGTVYAEDVEVLGYISGNIESQDIHLGEKAIVKGDLNFENNLSVLAGADILGRVQKIKKDKFKKVDTDKVKYLDHTKAAS